MSLQFFSLELGVSYVFAVHSSRYQRWGGGWQSRPARKMPRQENCLKNAQTPQRRVHALLGGLLP
jgi:hypothetical protein